MEFQNLAPSFVKDPAGKVSLSAGDSAHMSSNVKLLTLFALVVR